MSAAACAWCGRPIPVGLRVDAKHCSQRCRQTTFRLRRRGVPYEQQASGRPLRIAYADPPYPGLADYYADQPTYGGEVDHVALVAQLSTFDGWALSTSARALREVLPLCPRGVRVCAWVKPIGVSSQTFGLHNTWEPLIVFGGRQLRPGTRDWLRAMPARKGGELLGRKPLAFCAFLFRVLGMLPGDELADLFPGTGIVARAWAEVNRRSSSCDASPVDERLEPSSTPARRVVEDLRTRGVAPSSVTRRGRPTDASGERRRSLPSSLPSSLPGGRP